jgi:hypothetical protein
VAKRSPAPTSALTSAPTSVPSSIPTTKTTPRPSYVPSASPTIAPTAAPTRTPTPFPTTEPTTAPSSTPTVPPTEDPKVVALEQQVAMMAKADKQLAKAAEAAEHAENEPWSTWISHQLPSFTQSNGGKHSSANTLFLLVIAVGIFVNTCFTLCSCFRGNVSVAAYEGGDQEGEEAVYLVPSRIPLRGGQGPVRGGANNYSVPQRYPPNDQNNPQPRYEGHGGGAGWDRARHSDIGMAPDRNNAAPQRRQPPSAPEGAFDGFEA